MLAALGRPNPCNICSWGAAATMASPTNCCCEHTQCCRMSLLRVAPLHPRIRGRKGSPDQLLLRAYTCALQNTSNQGCTQGSTCYKGSADQVLLQAYTCALQNDKPPGSPKDQRLQRFARPRAAAGTHMCVAEYINAESHRGSRYTKVWPTKFCWEHTHVCCRTDGFRVAPQRSKGTQV